MIGHIGTRRALEKHAVDRGKAGDESRMHPVLRLFVNQPPEAFAAALMIVLVTASPTTPFARNRHHGESYPGDAFALHH